MKVSITGAAARTRAAQILASACVLNLTAQSVLAADKNWLNASGGSFHLGTNWSGNTEPGASDYAHFLPSSIYTVNLASSRTIAGIIAHYGRPTLDLGGQTLNLSNGFLDPLIVGQVAGESAELTIRNGFFNVYSTAPGFAVSINKTTNQASSFILAANSTSMIAADVRIGEAGLATMNLTGTATVGDPSAQRNVYLGYTSTGYGNVNVTTTGRMTVNGNIYVGGDATTIRGNGQLRVEQGGSLTVSGAIKLYNVAGGGQIGLVNIASSTVTAGAIIDDGAISRFQFNSGTVNLTGSNSGSVFEKLSFGTSFYTTMSFLNQTGGTATYRTSLSVGVSGPGTFNLSGGFAQVIGALQLGSASTGNGVGEANVSSTGRLSCSSVDVGYYGTGTFTQSGGVVDTFGTLSVATLAGSTGSFALSAGALSEGLSCKVGDLGVGTFTQTGGTHAVNTGGTSSGLVLGAGGSTGQGTYSISGTGVMNVKRDIIVGGNSGTGVLNISGNATVTTDSNLLLPQSGGSAVNLTGGALSVISIDTFGAPSRFNWSGGALTINALRFGPTGPLGQSRALAQNMSLTVSTDLTLEAGSLLALAGGNLTAKNILYGGDPNRFSWTSGNLTLTNTAQSLNIEPGGLAGPSLSLTAMKKLRSAGPINLRTGGLLNVSGNGLNSVVNWSGGGLVADTLLVGESVPSQFAYLGTAVTIDSSKTLRTTTSIRLTNGGSIAQLGGSHQALGSLAIASDTLADTGTYTLVAGGLTAGSIVNGGTLRYTGGTLETSSLQLVHDGRLSLGFSGRLVVKTGTLSVGAQTQIDLADNALIATSADAGVFNGTYSGLSGLIARGRNGGTWDGLGIITSMPDAMNGLYTLGVGSVGVTGSTLGGYDLAPTDVVIRYTLSGDFTLDGVVNFNDLLPLARNYKRVSLVKWADGDSNYDGTVNFADLILLSQTYGRSLIAPGTVVATAAMFEADWQLALSLVPEPIALLAAALICPLMSRRRVAFAG